MLGYGTPLLDDQGHPRGTVAVLVDITERKRAEETLQESEEKFRLLFENMTEGVALHEMIRDDTGRAVDYPAFSTSTLPTRGKQASPAKGRKMRWPASCMKPVRRLISRSSKKW